MRPAPHRFLRELAERVAEPRGHLGGEREPLLHVRIVWREEDAAVGLDRERTVTYRAGVIGGRSNGTLGVSNDAGHYVFRDVPDLALEAVRWVVDAARDERL